MTTRARSCSAAVLLLWAGALVLVQCHQKDEASGQTPSPTATSTVPAPWASLDVGAFAEAEIKIEHLRKQSEVDWAAIRRELDLTLPVVQFMDRHKALSYDAEMASAFAKCQRGERPKVHQQAIAKGLQHVAVLGIQHELSLLSGADGAAKATGVKRIRALASGIRPTFVRRDKDYFDSQPTLAKGLDEALDGVRDAVQSKEPPLAATTALTDSITRTYALSVLYEIEQVEKLRQKDLDACEVKRTEAVIFYRIIGESISKRQPRAHATILAMLQASPDQMNASMLKAELQKGLPRIDLP